MKPALIAVLLVCYPGLAMARCHQFDMGLPSRYPNAECHLQKNGHTWECADNPGDCSAEAVEKERAAGREAGERAKARMLQLLQDAGHQQLPPEVQEQMLKDWQSPTQPPDEGWYTVYGPNGPYRVWCDHAFGCREMMGQ